MSRCHDCQHYANLTKKATGGGVEFTRRSFVEWKSAVPERRKCVYCGINGEELYELNIVNPRTKKRLEVIGVDRRDNQLAYRLDNLDPCCPLCNQIKSQLLTLPRCALSDRTYGSSEQARLDELRARARAAPVE
jgi:5-methylcytosine-specific restriction endonuclease McrA